MEWSYGGFQDARGSDEAGEWWLDVTPSFHTSLKRVEWVVYRM